MLTIIKIDSSQSTKSFSEPKVLIDPTPISLTATAGVPFQYQLPALLIHNNAIYSSPQLPGNGLSLSYETYPPSIVGAPNATGVMNLTVTATANVNSQIESAWVAITITVNPPTPISLTATAGVPFKYEMPVLLPYNSAGYTSPQLPGNGLRLSYQTYPPSIVGAPNATGVTNLTVSANTTVNGEAKAAWVPISLTVMPATPISLTATAGVPFEYPIPYLLPYPSGSYTATGLPDNGLSLSFLNFPPSIKGTPTATGVMNLTINATITVNSQDESAWKPISITVNPAPNSFAIATVNLISCQPTDNGQRLIKFNPVYSGLTGEKIVLAIAYDNFITDQPGPYTLQVPTDQPILTFIAQQGSNTAVYNYRWLDACTVGPANQPPTTAGIPNQTTQPGQAYQLSLANYFADPDGNPLTFIVSGLPSTLNQTGVIISGTPTSEGSFPVSVTAVDPEGLFVTTSFLLMVNGTTPPIQPFALVSVTTNGCQSLGRNQWQVTFTPQYTGLTGDQLVLAMTNGTITTQAGPYSPTLSTDQPLLTLIAQQGGTTSVYNYNWLSACNAGARRAAIEPIPSLQVKVLGNPVQGQQVELEIRGVVGSWVEVSVLDAQGRSDHPQRLAWSTDGQRVSVPLGWGMGVQLVKVQTEHQSQTVKVIKGY
ncbi:hypothetical protein GCM10028805_37010 [Spirosoma harenae]